MGGGETGEYNNITFFGDLKILMGWFVKNVQIQSNVIVIFYVYSMLCGAILQKHPRSVVSISRLKDLLKM